jgi:hypothetical protein
VRSDWSLDPIPLATGERVPARAFSDPETTASDLEVLSGIRTAQRDRLAEGQGGGTWIDRNGATHWLVAPRSERALDPTPCLAVGFFGQARSDVDHTIIVQLEHAMLARAEEIPGLIAYHNVQLADAQWGNLVLFAAGTDTAPMRAEPTHADAIGRAPAHYHSLRLHRGILTRVGTTEEIELAATLYLDFDTTPPWRAVRTP